MELRHLRYFLAAAQSQSFTRASNDLHITQPTLSHQIKQLEEELGVLLFDRVGRAVQLTTAGELFRTCAKRCLQEIDSGIDALHGLENLRHGKLTVGVLSSFGTFLLPPILAEFNAAYPGIKITVLRLRSSEIHKRLQDGELHLGIAYAQLDSDQLNAEPLIVDRLALLVGDCHPLAARTEIDVGVLNDYGLIMLTADYQSRKLIDAALAIHNVNPRVIIEMNAIEPILATVRHSGLATILAARLAGELSDLHQIALNPTVTHTVSLLTRRNSALPAAANALAAAIRRRF
jgi:LysR family cyn operon transcriptional activator